MYSTIVVCTLLLQFSKISDSIDLQPHKAEGEVQNVESRTSGSTDFHVGSKTDYEQVLRDDGSQLLQENDGKKKLENIEVTETRTEDLDTASQNFFHNYDYSSTHTYEQASQNFIFSETAQSLERPADYQSVSYVNHIQDNSFNPFLQLASYGYRMESSSFSSTLDNLYNLDYSSFFRQPAFTNPYFPEASQVELSGTGRNSYQGEAYRDDALISTSQGQEYQNLIAGPQTYSASGYQFESAVAPYEKNSLGVEGNNSGFNQHILDSIRMLQNNFETPRHDPMHGFDPFIAGSVPKPRDGGSTADFEAKQSPSSEPSPQPHSGDHKTQQGETTKLQNPEAGTPNGLHLQHSAYQADSNQQIFPGEHEKINKHEYQSSTHENGNGPQLLPSNFPSTKQEESPYSGYPAENGPSYQQTEAVHPTQNGQSDQHVPVSNDAVLNFKAPHPQYETIDDAKEQNLSYQVSQHEKTDQLKGRDTPKDRNYDIPAQKEMLEPHHVYPSGEAKSRVYVSSGDSIQTVPVQELYLSQFDALESASN